MSLGNRLSGVAVTALSVMFAGGAAVADQPEPWQTGFQPAASPVMERISDFNDLMYVIIGFILLLVLALLVYVAWRFNAKRNPVPSRTTHNTLIEVLWTAIPTMILIVIAVPSFKLLYFMDRAQNAEMTIKAIGQQFNWTYEYPDHGDLTFDSVIACGTDEECAEAAEGGRTPLRLLDTDNRVVLPVDTTIRILVTARDVLHAWAVPAFGIKTDAVPGRINETWVRIEREGVYYGQCSELCGTGHGFMPIAVEAVSKEAFAVWLEKAKEEFASDDAPGSTTVARAAPGGDS